MLLKKNMATSDFLVNIPKIIKSKRIMTIISEIKKNVGGKKLSVREAKLKRRGLKKPGGTSLSQDHDGKK